MKRGSLFIDFRVYIVEEEGVAGGSERIQEVRGEVESVAPKIGNGEE